MTKPVLLLFGNCQSQMICFLLKHVSAVTDRFRVEEFPSWEAHDAAQWDRLSDEYIKDTVILWEQVESDLPNPLKEQNKAELYRRLPPGCEVVRFPAFYFMCLWPFTGGDPRQGKSDARYPGGRYPLGDVMASELADKADMDDDALFDLYNEKTAPFLVMLDRRLEIDGERMQVIDGNADIKGADYVMNNFRRQRLFYHPWHASIDPLLYVTREMMDRTMARHLNDPALARAEVADLFSKAQTNDLEEVPLDPRIAAHFGLSYAGPDTLYRWHAHRWTFKQYMLNYIRYADYITWH